MGAGPELSRLTPESSSCLADYYPYHVLVVCGLFWPPN